MTCIGRPDRQEAENHESGWRRYNIKGQIQHCLQFFRMAQSIEYNTVVNCTGDLEFAVKDDKEVVNFLHLHAADEAGLLVTRIRDRVKLDKLEYHKLMKYLNSRGKKYEVIVCKLTAEYRRLGGAGVYGVPNRTKCHS